MANINKVFLMGNLTRDPELRYTQTGLAVATFTIAVNHIYKTQSGEKKEEADFIRIKVLGKQAENCAKYLNKGRPVFVEGRLKFNTWESQDGQKKSSLDVVGQNIQFLGKSDSGNQNGNTFQNNNNDKDNDKAPEEFIEDDIPF